MVAEITSVVPTTRSWRLRRQRYLIFPVTECSRRSRDLIRIVIRCGSQPTIQRTSFLRRSAISHASRTSRRDDAAGAGSDAPCSGVPCAAVACVPCSGAAGAGTAATGGDTGTEPAASALNADRSMPGSARSRLVAHAADRDDDLRVLRVLLDLGPEPLHVHVHQPRVRGVPVAPDLLEQHLAGEDLPWLAGQRDQQVELERSEVERLSVPLHRV